MKMVFRCPRCRGFNCRCWRNPSGMRVYQCEDCGKDTPKVAPLDAWKCFVFIPETREEWMHAKALVDRQPKGF